MLTLLVDTLTNQQVLIATFAALAVAATVYTLVQPFFERDRLAARIKSVALEREQIRARERARRWRSSVNRSGPASGRV